MMSEIYDLEQKHIVNGMSRLADELILEKQKDLANKNFTDDDATEVRPLTVIDQLFRKRDELGLEEMRDEINTFVVAVSSFP